MALWQASALATVCPENGELESQFTAVLGSVTHYDIDGDQLILLQQGAIKALFKALPSEVVK